VNIFYVSIRTTENYESDKIRAAEVIGNTTNNKTTRVEILYVQPEMKFRSPPSHFHHEPPLHRAIKSAGRRYTISLLVNYTGNPELCSFYCSMLRPNNACRKHLILSFYQRKKKFSIRRQWLPTKDLSQL